MEEPMPYLHCPNCRLTVHAADGEPLGAPCPRCGEPLADEPRSLFAEPPVRSRRFSRPPAPTRLTPEAVRAVLARRGGRWRREGAPPVTRPA
jgi:hypothetical protein